MQHREGAQNKKNIAPRSCIISDRFDVIGLLLLRLKSTRARSKQGRFTHHDAVHAWGDAVDDNLRLLSVKPVLELLGEHEQRELAVRVRLEHFIVIFEHRVLESERFWLYSTEAGKGVGKRWELTTTHATVNSRLISH